MRDGQRTQGMRRFLTDRRIRQIALIVLALGLAAVSTIIVSRIVDLRRAHETTEGWRRFYGLLKADLRPGDVIVMDTLVDRGWQPAWFYAPVYFKDYLKYVPLLTTHDEKLVFTLHQIANFHIRKQKLYCAFMAEGVYRQILTDPTHFAEPAFKKIDTGGLLMAIEYDDPTKSLVEKAAFFYERLIELLPKTQTTCRILRLLTNLEIARSRFDRAIYYLGELKRRDTAGLYAGYVREAEQLFEAMYANYLKQKSAGK